MFWDAVAALGLPRTGHLTVIAATGAEDTSIGDAPRDIETMISSHPAIQDAWFRLNARSQIGIVSMRRNDPDVLDSIAGSICSDVPVLIGLSSPFTAVTDCSKSRAQAQVAMAASATSRPITRYNRDVLPVLLASAPDAAAAVVAATLGPVLELPPDRAEPLPPLSTPGCDSANPYPLRPQSCIVIATPSTTGCVDSPNSPDDH